MTGAALAATAPSATLATLTSRPKGPGDDSEDYDDGDQCFHSETSFTVCSVNVVLAKKYASRNNVCPISPALRMGD
jgi:hypothetical protein